MNCTLSPYDLQNKPLANADRMAVNKIIQQKPN